MTTHEGHYKRCYPLATIHKGPGTKALLAAAGQPHSSFTFEGTAAGDCEFYLGIPRPLAEAQHLGDDNFVLWLSSNSSYPHYVERMVYNGHNRSGLSEYWEKKLPLNATAKEKAEHADVGSVATLPVEALWTTATMFAVLAWLGWELRDSGMWGLLMIFGLAAVEFAGLAIWKQDRDRFWHALDTINSLDLRRPPNS